MPSILAERCGVSRPPHSSCAIGHLGPDAIGCRAKKSAGIGSRAKRGKSRGRSRSRSRAAFLEGDQQLGPVPLALVQIFAACLRDHRGERMRCELRAHLAEWGNRLERLRKEHLTPFASFEGMATREHLPGEEAECVDVG